MLSIFQFVMLFRFVPKFYSYNKFIQFVGYTLHVELKWNGNILENIYLISSSEFEWSILNNILNTCPFQPTS